MAPARADWPIIVGGCHRSGTSVVRRILDSHTRIHCGPEVKLFPDLFGVTYEHFRYAGFVQSVHNLAPREDLVEVLGAGLAELHRRAALSHGKPRWADKAPENIRFWREWQVVLGEEWLLVHVVRNPLDTIASMIEAQFPELPWEPLPAAEHYAARLREGAQFGAAHPERYHVLQYEQLAAEPQRTIADLMEWLGERFEPAQLAFNDRPHEEGLEDPKVLDTTEVHSRSVHQWRSRLTLPEAELVWDVTEPVWSEFDPQHRFVAPPPDPGRP